jgi:hypothetical protein
VNVTGPFGFPTPYRLLTGPIDPDFVMPANGPMSEPPFVIEPIPAPPLTTTARRTPDWIVPRFSRLVSWPFTVTPNWDAVKIEPALTSDADVLDDATLTGSPLRPLDALFDTVTPVLMETAAPVASVSGVVPPRSQLALMVSPEVTGTPPLQAAVACGAKLTARVAEMMP